MYIYLTVIQGEATTRTLQIVTAQSLIEVQNQMQPLCFVHNKFEKITINSI